MDVASTKSLAFPSLSLPASKHTARQQGKPWALPRVLRKLAMGHRMTRTLWAVAVLLTATGGCEDDRATVGQPCTVAQDCVRSLVCALTEEGGGTRVCAESERTRPQLLCTPGGSDVPCDLVLLRGAGESCSQQGDCQPPLECAPEPDAGAGSRSLCTQPLADGGTGQP